MNKQMDLEDYIRALPAVSFGGETYVPSLDRERLADQFLRVWDLMIDQKWRTLREIAAVTGDPEASISARLRDVRKDWGEDAMLRRRRPGIDARAGVHEYRLNFKRAD